MDKQNEQAPKKYTKPAVKRIKLEDKRVVSMAACKTGPDDVPCQDEFGGQGFDYGS
ncbi:MAG TPA: hypothetical protein P5567_13045 [Kiritimatiellia bacterium]|nr:hypothetical protein [Kiritimatiellia bacterium]HRZ13369.1 hypothetical protein [Kiritimatiellia bacterium]HSA18991.1 hypothetical protein [Kiritimatiellia bacterium]